MKECSTSKSWGMPKRSVSPIRKKELKADTLIQQASRLMWRGHCSRCGVHSDSGAGHHMIPRRYTLYRHTLLNVPYVCDICHHIIHNAPRGENRYLIHLKRKWPDLWKWWHEHRFPEPESPVNYDAQMDEQIEELKQFIKNNGG